MIGTGLKTYYGAELIYDETHIKQQIAFIANQLKYLKPVTKEKHMIIHEAFNSGLLEGADTTIAHVRMVYNDSTQSFDDRLIVNTIKTLYKIYEGYKLSMSSIARCWENITGKHLLTQIHNKQELKCLSDYINSDATCIIKAIVTHFYFMYIHPFPEYNGLLARILQNQILFEKYPKIKSINISGNIWTHQDEYDKKIMLSGTVKNNTIDITYFVQFMLDRLESACWRSQINLTTHEYLVYIKLKNAGLYTQITSRKAAMFLKISTDKARAVLNNLVTKGLLEKQKDNNQNIYTLIKLI